MLGWGCCNRRSRKMAEEMATQTNASLDTKTGFLHFKLPGDAQPKLTKSASAPGDIGLSDKQKSNSSLGGLLSVDEPEYVKAEASEEELPLIPQKLAQSSGALKTSIVKWRVDGRRLNTGERHVISPSFKLPSNQGNEHDFRIKIHARRKDSSRTSEMSFNVAQGCGAINLMLQNQCQESESFRVGFRLSVGSGRPGSNDHCPTRESVRHDFSNSRVAKLDKDDIWNFRDIVDTQSQTFLVCLVVWQAH